MQILLLLDKFCLSDAAYNELFYGCKKQLLQIQLLVHFEMKKLLKLTMDTSLSEVGGIISHEMDGQESPIAFTSRTLTAIEKN